MPSYYPPPRSRERGMALFLVMIAIVVMGALVTGAFFAGRMDMSGGLGSSTGQQAGEAAEAGLSDIVANWPASYNAFGIGGDSVLGTVTVASGLRYTPTLTRLGGGLYYLRSKGERLDAAGNVMTTRLLGSFLRLVYPDLGIQAAVTAKGNVTVGGNADISGIDTNPSGWTGCSAPSNKGGVRSNQTVSVGGSATVSGVPPIIQNDPTVVDSIFQTPFNTLLPLATKTINPGNYNGLQPSITGSPAVCNTTDPNNWGEPYAPPTPGVVTQCQSYYPIIHATGQIKLQTGRGQGVLLADGDVELRGNFVWDGIILALGQVKTNGSGNKVTGAVLANDAQLGDLTSFIGNPTVTFSSCAVARALINSATVSPLAERSWVQLYQ